MSSVFGDLRHSSVVAIFLSTASEISVFAPSPDAIDSDRHTEEMTLLLPFTELAMHPFAPGHFEGDLTLGKVRSIEVSATVGRPLYASVVPFTVKSNSRVFLLGGALNYEQAILFRISLSSPRRN